MSQEHTKSTHDTHRNQLASSKSPYLLQHANNPVDWYPWGTEAFEKAGKENKPVFLSIGYSTCHWCHVMAHESFEDPEVARLMNDVFVCIKVDREERPDIDSIYMAVCQMLTQRGGWPLTIIMTPDKKPFFAATYIPKESQFGRIGMMELIPRIKEAWKGDSDKLLESADQITAALREATVHTPGDSLGDAALDQAYTQLAGNFDEVNGGFGRAPKFPTPHNFLFLLRYWKRTGEDQALDMVERTLEVMRRGGVYDHLGFGFHRYSTDSEWLLPHFEKMLYDQAMLSLAYSETYQATGKQEYSDTAQEIFEYVLRDMTSPEGGFYSAEDADSEGEEGKFYVWTDAEIRKVLDADEADLFIRMFNVKQDGNFKEEATGEPTGSNILHLTKSMHDLAAELEVPLDALRTRMEAARRKLFAHREARIHPHKDDKILTDWNGLMIAALAKGALAFQKPEYAEAATRAADFVLGVMRNSDGRLLHRYREGEAGIDAHADDYAFMVFGLLNLYEATFDVRHLQSAIELNRQMIEHFWDEESGGFFFTAHDAEDLLIRRKEIEDGAIPSGNSVAMLNLLRLARITGDGKFENMASKINHLFSSSIERYPSAFTQFLAALDFAVSESNEVVLAGTAGAKDVKEMVSALSRHFIPNMVLLFRPTGEEKPAITDIAGYTAGQTGLDGKATVYVCTGFSCEQPTTDKNKMLELLGVR